MDVSILKYKSNDKLVETELTWTIVIDIYFGNVNGRLLDQTTNKRDECFVARLH